MLLANGAGATRAAAAADVAAGRAGALASVGFCGALDPALAVGDIFVATAVTGLGRCFPAGLPPTSRPHASGVLATIGTVARTAGEKRALSSGGASAVDMEAAGVAERAQKSGLPFYCIRSVTDLALENLANDFNSALREDGHFDTMTLLRAALSKPGVCLPELYRLWVRSRAAARELGEFIADCRF
jgi:nucleoside phosphorylase